MVFLKDNTGFILLHSEITQFEADEALAFIYGIEHMDEVTDILVSINSGGGSVLAGMSIFSALRNSTKNVETRIEGIGASIAGVIFLAGEKKTMLDYSLFMMHNPSGGDQKVLAKIKEMLKKVLSKEFDMKKLDKMMNDETWLDAKEMKKLGIIDKIINTNKEVELELSNETADLYAVCNNVLKNKYTEMENENVENNEIVETEEVVNEVEAVEETVEIVNETEEVTNEVEAVEEDANDILINELKKQLEEAMIDNKKMKEELDVINEVKIKEEKLEVLNNSSITEGDYDKWMNLELDVIKNLTETLTVNIEAPKNVIEDVKEVNIDNMTQEEKLRFAENNKELYVKLLMKK